MRLPKERQDPRAKASLPVETGLKNKSMMEKQCLLSGFGKVIDLGEIRGFLGSRVGEV